MHNQCCVENCGSRREDYKLHAFPSREMIARKWLQHINCAKLRNLDLQELHKLHVCEKHFERRFINPQTQRLRSAAYPTLFTEDEIISGVPTVEDIAHYADGKLVSETLKNTAEIVSFFDDLFDSVNGASLYKKSNKGKDLRKAVTVNSAHHTFWTEAVQKLEKIKFLDKNNKETSVPSLKNWIVTLKSYRRLWNFFHSKNINIMRPRYFNTDPIENFFGQVRAYNLQNNDPDCHTFICTYKSLLITRFINFHYQAFNCEDESGDQLIKIRALFERKNTEDNLNVESSLSNVQTETHLEQQQPRRQRMKIHSRAYTVGWVVRKIMSKNHCDQCSEDLSTTESGSIHDWITFKEYSKEIKRELIYPSEETVRYFGNVIEETNNYLEAQPHKNNISKQIKKSLLDKYSFLLNVLNDFLDITIIHSRNNWCNTITKILKGTDVSRLSKTDLPPMQLKALNEYCTKLKNKKLNK